jgi:malto-oligosyltrehalose synthase/4-alpha-glucanotransferase
MKTFYKEEQMNSTYRIQFHKDFNFSDLEKILPYLSRLGAGAIYGSPVFHAVPGSMHGYDGLDPLRINPEIGDLEQWRKISQTLRQNGMEWMQDIVPNHLAFHPRNEMVRDLLELGPASAFAPVFDTMLYAEEPMLMVPFLGSPVEELLTAKKISVGYEDGRLVIFAEGVSYPVRPGAYAFVLQAIQNDIPGSLSGWISEVSENDISSESWKIAREKLASILSGEKEKEFLESCLAAINEDPDLLRQLLSDQHYRLCYWKETDQKINYRRFFTVNGLICTRVQDPEVFESLHSFLAELLKQGLVQGLRVDHVDGLFDPPAYLEQLRGLAGDVPIVVEKILAPGEYLPENWPIEGTTGYDFLFLVNNLLTLKQNETFFHRFYKPSHKGPVHLHDLVHEKKSLILEQHMGGELENLYRLFIESKLVDKKRFSSIRETEMKEAIGAFLVHCPVYRLYGNEFPLPETEANAVREIIRSVKHFNPELERSAGLLEEVFLHQPHEGNEERNERTAFFYQRCMQFSGPLMAKGVEDTLMYTYNRFIGHSEVGDSPGYFGIMPSEFHQSMKYRMEKWPETMNATSTHDTKRGEDVRARLNVLTAMGEKWTETIESWIRMNAVHKKGSGPDMNDEIHLYQNMIGAFPVDEEERKDFPERIITYMEKAMREAKTHSSWTEPNPEYEQAMKDFIQGILDPAGEFFKDLSRFHDEITDHGIINSLVQTTLKFTCPGRPDVYQGTELWDQSLVDPDNRRPVDFEKRIRLLDEIDSMADPLQELWENRRSGAVKLWLTRFLFGLRNRYSELFGSGEYIPLATYGKYKDNLLAFLRVYRQKAILVAVPLHTGFLSAISMKKYEELDWEDTEIVLPEGLKEEWTSGLDQKVMHIGRAIRAQELFRSFPVAIFTGHRTKGKRSAGLLLHLTSLPSPFGIGDMGKEAYRFLRFLGRAQQKFWQLLPLNPVSEAQQFSPYSAYSTHAGNTWLISPELLEQEGLLTPTGLFEFISAPLSKVDFAHAAHCREALFEKAWERYRSGANDHWLNDFQSFCEKENYWLHDFSLYQLIRQQQDGKPWFEWPDDLKKRNADELDRLGKENAGTIEKTKWLQFIFYRQWKMLKQFASELDIQFIGDLPFYVSYDSADVWTNQELFALDENGKMTGVAGVPPDAFTSDGQLWGMPVYNWENMKAAGYDWWIKRLKHQVEVFDLVRLDHFRAFSAYWEVPANETTAKNGTWKPGPGKEFFEALERSIGGLPFIAEDLGEIDEPVYQLRDAFGLPGMKVLQFAFGGDMPGSIHIPHNYSVHCIAYTGTHDNNTTRGWFEEEDKDGKALRLEQYIGRHLSSAEISLVLSRLAYGSVAETVILPVQDVLNLGNNARMNDPGGSSGNWSWRLLPGQLDGIAEENLKRWAGLYNRS